jgi:spore germination protein KB
MPGKSKEKISSTELWAAMFILITSVAMSAPIGALAGNQSWISTIIAIIIALGFALVYTHLSDSNSGKSIIEIGELLFGKWGGKIIGFLYAGFCLEISSYVMKDNWQMTSTVALHRTPIIVIAITAIIVVLWITYEGIETIGRLSTFVIPFLVSFLGIAFILLIKDFNFNNFLPITVIEWRKVLYSGIQTSIHPLSVTAIFTMIFPSLTKRGQAKAPGLYAVAAAGLLILFTNTIYLLALGPLVPKLTYPGYTAYSYIEVADFIDRAEILFYTLFLVMNILELSIAFYVAALCLAKVFGINNYRVLLIPLGFIVVEWSTIIVKNHAEHIRVVTYTYPWYAMIYEFFIPILLLIFSAIRKRKKASA